MKVSRSISYLLMLLSSEFSVLFSVHIIWLDFRTVFCMCSRWLRSIELYRRPSAVIHPKFLHFSMHFYKYPCIVILDDPQDENLYQVHRITAPITAPILHHRYAWLSRKTNG